MMWFLFAGDMLVMLFMAAVAVWVLWRSPDTSIKDTANIPLQDEAPSAGTAGEDR